MKEVKHYICEICGTEYNDKIVCSQCEVNHKKPKEITFCSYLPKSSDASGCPNKINVKMSDGTIVTYKR